MGEHRSPWATTIKSNGSLMHRPACCRLTSLDGEMENYVRIAPPSFDLTVKLPRQEDVLHFMAIANNATGEKVGSTALFEAQADWLKTNNNFDAVLKEINVEGTVFTNVAFNFPKGNEKD